MKPAEFPTRAAIVAALIVLLGVGAVWSWQGSSDGAPAGSADAMLSEEPLELVTASGTHKLVVEVARTSAQQAKGLMFRSSLAEDRGMLFPYEGTREISMWMRNTYIPLDMVFIKRDGTVHRVEERTEPLSERIVSSQGEAAAVLELAGGAAAKYGLKPGDHVRHAFFTPSTAR